MSEWRPGYDPNDWSPSPGFGEITMPGRIEALSTGAGKVWALVEMQRAWWQFWKPVIYHEWQEVLFASPPSE